MADRELEFSYDSKADVLYVTIVPDVPAIAVETESGVIARVDPETNEIVGFTVVGLLERLSQGPARIETEGRLRLPADLALA